MKKILVLIILVSLISINSYGLGLSVDDLIADYNKKYIVTWYNCDSVSRDFYNALYQNFQLANLEMIGIKTGTTNPLTNSDGHAVVTYTVGRNRYVITTFTDDGKNFYVKKLDVGYKSLHEIAEMFYEKYKYVKVYKRGFGFIPKSRTLLMNESGHEVEKTDDIWSRVGKHDLEEHKRAVWSI